MALETKVQVPKSNEMEKSYKVEAINITLALKPKTFKK